MIQSIKEVLSKQQALPQRKLININYSCLEYDKLKVWVDKLPSDVNQAVSLCTQNMVESPKDSGCFLGTIKGDTNEHIGKMRYRVELVLVEKGGIFHKAYYRAWVNKLSKVYVRELEGQWDAPLPGKDKKSADIF